MSRRIVGSICVTDIIEAAKAGNPGFTKGKKNGKLYVNAIIWENDEPNDDGDIEFTALINNKKEDRDAGVKKVYIGNFKEFKRTGGRDEQVEVGTEDIAKAGNSLDIADDLPF